jgi:FkbM family methyltransferase
LSLNPYYRRISRLPITHSGLSDDGVPFVRLENGKVFYGYLPTSSQRYYYKFFLKPEIKPKLREDCINVAFDIVVRYIGPDSPKANIRAGKYYDFLPGQTIVEVGAYIGYYAMRAAELVGEAGKVVAVEAIEANLLLLKKNVEANHFKNIVIVPKAAWKSAGSLRFYRHARQQASAISSVIADAQEQVDVPCDTLDSILKDLKILNVRFVRLQVNGAEHEVLMGMNHILEEGPDLLVAAIYDRNGQKSWKEIKLLLENNRYSAFLDGGSIFAVKEPKAYI